MGKGRKTLVLVIDKLRKKYTLKALLNYTKLAKSTYYDALKKLYREDKYKGLKTLIHNICNKNHVRYAYVEKLEQEVYQLRMENDLLKKWHALMKQWEKEGRH